MDLRKIAYLTLVCLGICSQAVAQTSYLFQLPGAGSGTTRALAFFAETAALNPPIIDTNLAPQNSNKVLVTPDGQRFYIVGDTTIQSYNAGLQTAQAVPGINGTITRADLTPDGKYLLVAATNFYIINTANNTAITTSLGLSGNMVDFAISPDSKRVWVLNSFTFGGRITPISLEALNAGTKIDTQYAGSSITLSPQGRLYVASQGNIAEYDADTLDHLSDTNTSSIPGPIHFNLDGSAAYFADHTPGSGYSVVAFYPATHTTIGWPSNTITDFRPVFDDIFFTSQDRLYGLDTTHTTLWEISTAPLGATTASFPGAFDSTDVSAITASHEIPSSRYLYVLTRESGRPVLERVALATRNLEVFSSAALTTGILQQASLPQQNGVSQVLKYNDNQTLAHGGPAKTLYAYVTDSVGRPIYNQTVFFSATSGVTLFNSTATTNANGYLQTTATLPDQPGTYTVSVTIGDLVSTFTVNVSTSGTGGGTGGEGGTPSQMTIARGDGQLIPEHFQTADYAPLTVKIVDQNGKPLQGVDVEYAFVEGVGALENGDPSAFTDGDGLASKRIFVDTISNTGNSFSPITIRATSYLGSVDFHIVVFVVGTKGLPQISDQAFLSADVHRGEVIPDFFETQILSTTAPTGVPITGVGLRVADGNDPSLDGGGTCVNNTLSDNNGVARCDFKASCSLFQVTQIQILIGELLQNKLLLYPQPGTSRQLTYLAGRNQSGNIGDTLGTRLTAQISDNCGDPVAGQAAVWTVTQGSATLSQVVSTSGTNGQISAQVKLGQTAGPIKVVAALPNGSTLEFNLTATVSVSGLALTSGGGQSVLPGQPFPSPVVFTVLANGASAGSNLTVNLSATNGANLNQSQPQTNAQGQVQTTVTAGSTPGTITVTATFGNFSASALLTVKQPTLPLTAASFANAASGVTGLVPCGLATAIGPGLAPGVNGVVNGSPFGGFGPFDTTVAGVSLQVNGIFAPILAISNQNGKEQINFQTPCEASPGNATVVVTVTGVATTVSGVPVFAAQPGISTFVENGKTYPVVVRAKDNSLIRPSNLAPTGETLYLLYVTGMGLVTPATGTNKNGQADQTAILPAVIGVDGKGVPTQPVRYSFGQIGSYYIEFKLDKSPTASTGTVLSTNVPFTVLVNVNGQPFFSQPGVLLPGVFQGQ